jgi:hypothetical protein
MPDGGALEPVLGIPASAPTDVRSLVNCPPATGWLDMGIEGAPRRKLAKYALNPPSTEVAWIGAVSGSLALTRPTEGSGP